ncbi:hypothetical protein FIC87_11210 [Eggerthella lenta]|uniref:Recombinase family protein n=1 Tax=Eggerthella lenta TaxID=84112 RepID=A0A5C5BT25_EGGLN|nr:recombinase family protein [Eggerthella lenta]TNU89454.1 hypothetical protein FIC87_11210 [Eggerthella lenta]
MNAVAYCRFSSSSQREASIEGQLKHCREYAEANGFTIIKEYVDRAASATNDQRFYFQQMIEDAESGQFEAVLVYQLDRFARSRYDSAIYKNKLRKLGVRVVSVKENITDDPSGMMLEGILETLAEYYSNDLALKIRRGQNTNAEHCLYNGGSVPFGYRIDESKHYQIDEETGPLAKRVFEQYAGGRSITEIIQEFNDAGMRTSRNKPFNKSTFKVMLQNRRYLGIYIYRDVEVPGGIPALVSQETFDAVQRRLGTLKNKRGVTGDYLLTTKLFCGHCGSMMVGVSGTSKTGAIHHYYACKKRNAKKCDKKNTKRDYIENAVLDKCREVLTDENISLVAKKVSELCAKEADSPFLKQLRKELKQADNAIDNLLRALENGQEADLLLERVRQKREAKEAIKGQIAKEELTRVLLTEHDIKFFLSELKKGSLDDEKYRKMLINVLINKVYLYDDRMTMFFNAGKDPVEITMEFQEEAFRQSSSNTTNCVPPLTTGAPSARSRGAPLRFLGCVRLLLQKRREVERALDVVEGTLELGRHGDAVLVDGVHIVRGLGHAFLRDAQIVGVVLFFGFFLVLFDVVVLRLFAVLHEHEADDVAVLVLDVAHDVVIVELELHQFVAVVLDARLDDGHVLHVVVLAVLQLFEGVRLVDLRHGAGGRVAVLVQRIGIVAVERAVLVELRLLVGLVAVDDMEALLGQVDARRLRRDGRQAPVLAVERRLALSVGAFLGEEALVGFLEVGLVVGRIELLVVLELFDVLEFGLLVDLLGFRLGAVLDGFQFLVQAHDGLLRVVRTSAQSAAWFVVAA